MESRLLSAGTWVAAVSCLLVCVAIAAIPATASAAEPIPLIFDTDIGNDIDDALALGMIYALESRGECRLLAVTVTKDEAMSAPYVDAVNTFYGRGNVPIGVVRNGPTPEPSKYTPIAAKKDGEHLRYPHRLTSGSEAPDAVALLRQTLAHEKDGSVVIVQVGASTNLARLLASPADAASHLSGTELVRQKVRLLSVMAGEFPATGKSERAEYNVKIDIPSAAKVFSEWPTPIVFSGYEVGLDVNFPATSIERDFGYVQHHPLAEGYSAYDRMPYDRPTWDLTSVLYAVRPEHDYFELSPRGRVHVAADGVTSFEATADGRHRYLKLPAKERPRVQEACTQLASQPPAKSAKASTPAEK